MVDTLGAYMPRNNTNNSLIESLLQRISNIETVTKDGIEKHKGYVQNIKVQVDQHGISTYGSLSRLLNGNNVQSLDSASLALAVEKLSDEMHFSMYDAKITRLDIAQNLSLSRPPSNYFESLLSQERKERLPHKHGVYFRNTQGESVFYDKIAEIKKYKTNVPKEIRDQNILKFEVRYYKHRNVCKRVGIPEMTVGKLCEPTVYRGLLYNWVNEYSKVEKKKEVDLFEDEVFRQPKKFCDRMTYQGIQSIGGFEPINVIIRQARERGVFKSYKQVVSLRRKIQAFKRIENGSIDNPLVFEMDGKVLDILLHSD